MQDKTKRKEWVKTVAIIFLSVLLVLTFFSNTIKNYSLPEVAAQYTNSGTITNKVRGQGTVDSVDPYNVIYKSSRKVESVKVKVGDEISKGDVLYELEASESEELKEAKQALERLKDDFEKSIVLGQISTDLVNKAENGMTNSAADLLNQISQAKKKVDNAQANLDALTKQQTTSDNSNETDKKIEELNTSKTAWITQLGIYNDSKILAASDLVDVSRRELVDGYTYTETYAEALKALSETANITNDEKNALIVAEYEINKEPVLADAIVNAVNLIYSITDKYKDQFPNGAFEINFTDVSGNDEAVAVTVNQLMGDALFQTKKADYVNAINSINNANSKIADIEKQINDITNAKKDSSVVISGKIDDAKKVLEKAEKNYNELIADITTSYDLAEKVAAIDAKEDEVKKLISEAGSNEIVSPVSGTLISVSYVAGETIEKGETVASVQVAGKGYTLTMPLTVEQAKLIAVGDEAEVTNSWWYSDIHARVKSIKPDPSNPAKGRIATFDIEGDVTSGQQLSLTVGKRSANYDNIVPNNAIHEDNNGKFILRVNSKNTPLGTRYIAERIDVTVIASDETQSAVSGDLLGWDFIITTSSKPIEDGTEIRLKD